eukprot:COSAG01_NODE_916_length_12760_cov_13.023379_14_plen_66_part_00
MAAEQQAAKSWLDLPPCTPSHSDLRRAHFPCTPWDSTLLYPDRTAILRVRKRMDTCLALPAPVFN